MNLTKLILKNIARRKGRFIFTLVGIVIGITSFVVLLLLGGSLQSEVKKQASDLGANLVVTPKGWCAYEQISVLTGEQLPEAIPSDVVGKISAIKGLTAVPYLIEKTAIENNPVSVIGIIPDDMKTFKKWDIKEGQYFTLPDEEVIVLGSGIAQQFKLKPSDKLTIRGKDFPVKGVLKETGGKDDVAIFIPLDIAQKLYGVKDNVSFISVKVDDISKIDTYILKIQENANVAVSSDKQLLNSVLSIIGTVNLTLQLIAAIALLTAAFGIINTMMMAIYERKREIGILQAIGFKRSTIFKMFILESGFYGVLGGIIGIILGILFSYLLNPYISQNEFTALIGSASLKLSINFNLILGSLIFSVVIAILAGVYPAWRASKLTPVEAISYE
ncbi:MAG: ABC transporter permease [Actinobacteria bacterium]|nr:ABC transporter permease [Actinomycetota bacterium]